MDLNQYFDLIVNWVDQHPHWTGVVIFLVAFLESLVLLGVLVPGAILMVAAGVLISMEKLSLGSTLIWAITGAIAGDGLSFWVGRYYKDGLRKIWPFSKSDTLLKRGENFFSKHGGKSIVFGRFVGPVRAIIPTVAGMMGMSPRHFTVVNVLSAIAWAPMYILPGLVVGAVSQTASESAIRLVIMFLVIVVALLISNWITRKLFAYLQARTQSITVKLLTWGQNHPWFTRYTQSLFNPESSAYRALIISTSILFIAGILLIALVSAGIHMDATSGVNTTINNFFRSLRTPVGDHIMTFITMLAAPQVYIPLLLATAFWFSLKKHWQAVFHLLFATGLTTTLVLMLKYGLATSRPDNAIAYHTNSHSFPSAHTTMALTVYGFLAILLANGVRTQLRSLPYLGTILVIISIAFSRIYLGIHWFTDVLGGIMIGLICLSITGISYQRHLHIKYSSRYLALLLSVVFILAVTINNNRNFSYELELYRPVTKLETLPVEQWQASKWREQTLFRYDLRGRRDQPLNIQYFGPIEPLKKALLDAGWAPPARFNFTSLVRWLQIKPELADLPVLRQVHDGQYERLLLTRQTGQVQYVIRLWASNKKHPIKQYRLLIGNASTQHLKQQLKIISYPKTGLDFLSPMQQIQQDLQSFSIKTVNRRYESTNTAIKWNKQLLLILPPNN